MPREPLYEEWLEFAQRWHGEHYGGRKTRYDNADVFPQYTIRSTKILYKFHAPDGTTTLTTTNIKEALEAIKNLR